MGLFFVLFFWLIVGLILAGLAGLVSKFLDRGKSVERKRGCFLHLMFPVGCLAWAGGIFLVSMIANAVLLDQDPGIGDGWECRLPGGFELLMIDVTDHGTIRLEAGEFPDELGDVILLQVTGSSFFGASDKSSYEERARDWRYKHKVNSYFILDWRIRKTRWFSTEAELRAAAEEMGVKIALKPILEVYFEYRNNTINYLALLLILGGPVYWIWRRRQIEGGTPTASSD
jgi:hypothetical protein